MNTIEGMMNLLEVAVKLICFVIIVLMFIYVRILSAKSKRLKKEIAYRNCDYNEKNNQEHNDLNNNNNPINFYDDEKADL